MFRSMRLLARAPLDFLAQERLRNVQSLSSLEQVFKEMPIENYSSANIMTALGRIITLTQRMRNPDTQRLTEKYAPALRTRFDAILSQQHSTPLPLPSPPSYEPDGEYSSDVNALPDLFCAASVGSALRFLRCDLASTNVAGFKALTQHDWKDAAPREINLLLNTVKSIHESPRLRSALKDILLRGRTLKPSPDAAVIAAALQVVYLAADVLPGGVHTQKLSDVLRYVTLLGDFGFAPPPPDWNDKRKSALARRRPPWSKHEQVAAALATALEEEASRSKVLKPMDVVLLAESLARLHASPHFTALLPSVRLEIMRWSHSRTREPLNQINSYRILDALAALHSNGVANLALEALAVSKHLRRTLKLRDISTFVIVSAVRSLSILAGGPEGARAGVVGGGGDSAVQKELMVLLGMAQLKLTREHYGKRVADKVPREWLGLLLYGGVCAEAEVMPALDAMLDTLAGAVRAEGKQATVPPMMLSLAVGTLLRTQHRHAAFEALLLERVEAHTRFLPLHMHADLLQWLLLLGADSSALTTVVTSARNKSRDRRRQNNMLGFAETEQLLRAVRAAGEGGAEGVVLTLGELECAPVHSELVRDEGVHSHVRARYGVAHAKLPPLVLNTGLPNYVL